MSFQFLIKCKSEFLLEIWDNLKTKIISYLWYFLKAYDGLNSSCQSLVVKYWPLVNQRLQQWLFQNPLQDETEQEKNCVGQSSSWSCRLLYLTNPKIKWTIRNGFSIWCKYNSVNHTSRIRSLSFLDRRIVGNIIFLCSSSKVSSSILSSE